MQRLNLYTEVGGVTVVTGGVSSTTKVMGVFPGATIAVFNSGTIVAASIFGDNLPVPTPKSNPFTSDAATGLGFFYAANGRYDVQISGAGFTTFTLGDYELTDPADATTIGSLTVTGNAIVGGTLGVTGLSTLTGGVNSPSHQVAGVAQVGTGPLVAQTGTTLIAPTLGVATATTVNKITLTQPATGATITPTDGKTLKYDNSLELAGTDGTKQTFPTTNATIARTDAGQTFTGVQVLAAPTINGTPTGTGIPTVTKKIGTGAGNYTTTSTTLVRPDATNLAFAVVIPTGWVLEIKATGSVSSATGVGGVNIALADGVADNTGILIQTVITPNTSGAATFIPFFLLWTVVGDGASHTINLQFNTGNAADAAIIVNNTSTLKPVMTFSLTPSN